MPAGRRRSSGCGVPGRENERSTPCPAATAGPAGRKKVHRRGTEDMEKGLLPGERDRDSERWSPCPAGFPPVVDEHSHFLICRPGERRGPYSRGRCLWVPAFAGTTVGDREIERWTSPACRSRTAGRCPAERTGFLLRWNRGRRQVRKSVLFSDSAKQPHVKEVNEAGEALEPVAMGWRLTMSNSVRPRGARMLRERIWGV
jgi:hypothetical protein